MKTINARPLVAAVCALALAIVGGIGLVAWWLFGP
jgi:hypothetical protein